METRKQVQAAVDEVENENESPDGSDGDRTADGDATGSRTPPGAGGAVAAFSPEPKDVSAPTSPPPDMAPTERCPATEAFCEPQSMAVSTWRPPPTVGRYEIGRRIGSGGMGQVYVAWDPDLQRRNAMKFILGIEPDATARERFMVEARATARIQHPNVVTIHEVGELDGRPYLVMEYLGGQTLDQIAKPMRWSRVLELGIALSCGLAAAHREGVLHRDIKPDNVMLTEGGQIKLLDFGLAKLATRLSTPSMVREPCSVPTSPWPAGTPGTRVPEGAGEGWAPVTSAGAIVGTPGYMAPESWRGDAAPQSDVYSLGALLFELCAGKTPYAEVAPHALSIASQQRDAPLLTEVIPTVDPAFARIVARCLSRDLGARYASAQELLDALKELERLTSPRPSPATEGCRSQETPASVRSMVFREIGALVVSVNSAEPPSDEEWSTYVRLCKKKKAEACAGVLVVTAGGEPTPTQRKALFELVGDGPILAAVVADAPMMLRTISVLGWHNPGIRKFSNIDDALEYLAVDGPTAIRVLSEIAAMQREVA